MDLATETIILVLAGEGYVFEAFEHDVHSLRRLSKHGLERDSYLEMALLSKSFTICANKEDLLDDRTEIRAFTGSFFN